jgi:uncharacterized protein (DUF433 family)
MGSLDNRITVDSRQCGGRPCIRGLRIRVTDVLDLLAEGLSNEQVLAELPDLELEDIFACLRYARRPLDPPISAERRTADQEFAHVRGRVVYHEDPVASTADEWEET